MKIEKLNVHTGDYSETSGKILERKINEVIEVVNELILMNSPMERCDHQWESFTGPFRVFEACVKCHVEKECDHNWELMDNIKLVPTGKEKPLFLCKKCSKWQDQPREKIEAQYIVDIFTLAGETVRAEVKKELLEKLKFRHLDTYELTDLINEL